jgi:hypothetical protein
MPDHRFPRPRAVLRTAVLWGAAWGTAAGALVAAISLFDPGLGVDSLAGRLGMALVAGIAWGARVGLACAVSCRRCHPAGPSCGRAVARSACRQLEPMDVLKGLPEAWPVPRATSAQR